MSNPQNDPAPPRWRVILARRQTSSTAVVGYPHTHDFFQIFQVLKGNGPICINDECYDEVLGTTFIVPPGASHRSEDGDGYPTDILDIKVVSTVNREDHFPLDRLPYRLPASGELRLQPLLCDIIDEYATKRFGWELVASSLVDQLFVMAFRLLDETTNASDNCGYWIDRTAIDHVFRFIHHHYAEPITLEDIARHAHMSVSRLGKTFRVAQGCTPFEYLIDYRLQRAMDMLRDQERMSMTQVAEATGFRSIHHFSRTFKKHVGQSPSQWRKAYIKAE